MPAETDALAHCQRTDPLADGGDGADDLMARDKRVMADAPVVGNEMNIAVTDAAVGDGNLHLLRTQRAWVVMIGQQFCPCRVHC